MANPGVAIALTGAGALYLASRLAGPPPKHEPINGEIHYQEWQSLAHGDNSNAGRMRNTMEAHDRYMARQAIVEDWVDSRAGEQFPANRLPDGPTNTDLRRVVRQNRHTPMHQMPIGGVTNKQGFRVGYRAYNPFPAYRAYESDYVNLAAVQ